MINGIFLLLGSNIGDRKWFIEKAKERIRDNDVFITDSSSCYLSPPWGTVNQPYFLNQVIRVESSLSPESLMRLCLKIENELGRIRKERYGSRTIDIDLLYYNQIHCTTESLTLPHPRLHERRFTLVPMNEIAPDFIHPVLEKSQGDLLADCPDPLPVRQL